MELAIFDLDNTLIAGDSDYLWSQFLVQKNLVDKTTFTKKNDHFMRLYDQGKLDIEEFLQFQLAPLAQHTMSELEKMRAQFINEKIRPLLLPKAINEINQHKKQGRHCLIITATNRFITQPIATLFNINTLIATEAEIKEGRYTGHVTNTPCFQAGKVTRLNAWLQEMNYHLKNSYFYSDSINDIALLQIVDNPYVVDADADLLKIAKQRHWKIISFRSLHTSRT